MKIGILTFHFAINYGAALQAFALKKFLLSQGHEVDILNYVPEYHKGADSDFKTPAQILSEKRQAGAGSLNCVLSLVKNTLLNVYGFRRRRQRTSFGQFQSDNLIDTKAVNSFEELLELEQSYNVIVIGSDQVWNPALTGGSFDPGYFGKSLNDGVKAISYAASSGSLISESNRDSFIALVHGIDRISVREASLCNQIRDWEPSLECATVLDPTMLLEPFDWARISETSGRFDDADPYILVYQLIPDVSLMSRARYLAKRDGIRIVNIGHKVIPGTSSLCDLSPDDFVNCFNNARYVVTNSFHGSVFSILFKRDFFVVYPSERSSRIRDLLDLLDLSSRAVEDDQGLECCIKSSIDYRKVFEVLERERDRSRSYLKDAI